MKNFLQVLAYIAFRTIGVAAIYYLLKFVFHYTCTPFECYVILAFQSVTLYNMGKE